MIKGVLSRYESTDQGTFGHLNLENGFSCRTAELPWRGNSGQISCIPLGVYKFNWINSPKHGMCYEAEAVPGRSNIQIHSANFAGDVLRGWESQLLGCIALGESAGQLKNKDGILQKAVLASRAMMKKFEESTQGETLEIAIAAVQGLDFRVD